METLEDRRLLAGGNLDPSFSGGGQVFTDFVTSGAQTLQDIAVLPDGGIVAVGEAADRFLIAKFTAAGVLDGSFGTNGYVTSDFNAPNGAVTLAVQSDGAILVGGTQAASSSFGSPSSYAIQRYLPNGILDQAWNGTGTLIGSFSATGAVHSVLALALQADGKVIAAGGDSANGRAVVRLLPNGSPDATFGAAGTGVVNVPLPVATDPTRSVARGLAVQPDGSVLVSGEGYVTGQTTNTVALARLTPAGVLDNSFSGDGRVTVAADFGRNVAVLPDGKILQFVESGSSGLVYRYHPDGSPDLTYNGIGHTNGMEGQDMTVLPDGRVVTVGSYIVNQTFLDFDLAINAFRPDGTLDSSFGSNGLAFDRNFGFKNYGNAIATTPDGRLLVAGAASTTTTHTLLLRYFGPTYTTHIAGYAYFDANRNGLRDATEGALGSTMLFLDYDGDGKYEIGEPHRFPDADGSFSFDVNPGTYQVKLNLSASMGYEVASLPDYVATVTVTSAGQTAAIDFPIRTRSGSIAGVVYDDVDANAARGASEPVIASRTVYLDANNNGVLDSGERSTSTFQNGAYAFTLLPAGTYTVRTVLPTGWAATHPAGGAHTVQLADGQNSFGLDVGTTRTGYIRGRFFNDADGDGTRESGDTGRAGQTVRLYRFANNVETLIATTTTTGSDGRYAFEGLTSAGQYYRVEVDPIPGSVLGGPGLATMVIAYGVGFGNANIGVYAGPVVRGILHDDKDASGSNTNGDSGLAEWAVYHDANGNDLYDTGERLTFSDSRGFWSLGPASLGAQTFRVLPHSGFRATSPVGVEQTVDVTSSPLIHSNVNFYFTNAATVTGRAYEDWNRNGTYDGATVDRYYIGMTVYADANGNAVRDTGEPSAQTASGTGTYTLALSPGAHRLRIESLPQGRAYGTPAPGYYDVTVAGGANATGRDFRLLDVAPPEVPQATVEVARSGATFLTYFVKFTDNSALDQTSFTHGDLRVTGPNGFSQLMTLRTVTPDASSNTALVSYVFSAPGGTWDHADNGTYVVQLLANELADRSGNFAAAATLTPFTVDLAAPPPGAISGRVYRDVDDDGVYDGPRERIATAGGRLAWRDVNANGARDAADPFVPVADDGTFQFTGVPVGAHVVGVTMPDNWSNDTPSTGSQTVTVTSAATAVANFSQRPSFEYFSGAFADTYVRDGTYASQNFGSATELVVKRSANVSNTRETYLRFLTDEFNGDVDTSWLRLFGRTTDASEPVPVDVYGLAGASPDWSQTAVTWNNKPAGTRVLLTGGTVANATGAWHEFDVTQFVRDQTAAGATAVTFAVVSQATTDAQAVFTATEAFSNPYNPPQLTITPAAVPAQPPLPQWLAPGSAVIWDADSKRLTVTGAATIVADPGADAPLITANGSAAVLTFSPSAGRAVHVGGLTLTGGATATLPSVASEATATAMTLDSSTRKAARSGAARPSARPRPQLTSVAAAAALRTAANSRVLVVNGNTFHIDASSTLDLADNNLILNYSGPSPAAGVESMVRAGFNGGTWLGKRITSSAANANRSFALAVSDNSGLAIPFTSTRSFAGEAVDTTAVLVKSTHRVDLDLDGVITTNDATIFNSNYGEGGSARWGIGDLDFDGLFTSNDATIFNSYYDESLGTV